MLPPEAVGRGDWPCDPDKERPRRGGAKKKGRTQGPAKSNREV